MSYASSCSATPPKSRVPTLGGGGWLTGHLLPLRRDPLGLFTRAVRELGDTVRIPLGGRELILLRHPDHVKHVLLDHSGNFNKQTRGFDALRILLGRGLLTSEGAFWLRQRRIAQPGFHRARISHFADQMVRCTEVALRGWEVKVGGEGELDVAAEMMALTLRIVGQTLLSTDVSGDTRLVGEAMPVLMTTMVRRVTSFFEWPAGIPTRENRAFARATRAMDRLIYRIIEERRRGEGQTDDLLDMLLNARDESSGERMSDVQVRDEVMTLFLAGHETTANTLTWVFHLLADHPEVAARARVEATAVLGTDRGERLPTFDDLPKLEYTARVIQEGMRLYPPVWMLARRSLNADKIGGFEIQPRTLIAVSPYLSHRNPAYFVNPERFDPDRFLPERFAKLPRFAYFPFGGGPHLCIGNHFAMMEAQLILAMTLQRFELASCPNQQVELEPTVTLRPRAGLRMRIFRTATTLLGPASTG